MTEHDHLTLDDVAYTTEVTLFLKTLARIMRRLIGQSESGDDNGTHEAGDRGLTDEME